MKKMYGFIGMSVRVCAFVLALSLTSVALTGCEYLNEFLGIGGDESEGDGTKGPGSSPKEFAPDLYATLWYMAGEEEGDSLDTTPFTTVGEALAAIQEAYNEDPSAWTGKAAGIVILGDMTIGTLTANDGSCPPIVLMGKAPGTAGEGLTLESTSNGSLLTVGSGVSLTLWNITLKGKESNNTHALVTIKDGGKLILEDGAVIRDNHNPTDYSQPNISKQGGGVFVSDGTLDIRGGTISGNTADMGGGVFVHSGAFTMTGGIIRGNTVTDNGGGVMMHKDATFTKTGGGTIYGYPTTDDPANRNVVNDERNRSADLLGHAVFIFHEEGGGLISRDAKLATTAGPEHNLFYQYDTSNEGWD